MINWIGIVRNVSFPNFLTLILTAAAAAWVPRMLKEAAVRRKKNTFIRKFEELKVNIRKIQQFGNEYINAVRCIRGKRQMTKLEKVAISHNFNFRGWCCFFF